MVKDRDSFWMGWGWGEGKLVIRRGGGGGGGKRLVGARERVEGNQDLFPVSGMTS